MCSFNVSSKCGVVRAAGRAGAVRVINGLVETSVKMSEQQERREFACKGEGWMRVECLS